MLPNKLQGFFLQFWDSDWENERGKPKKVKMAFQKVTFIKNVNQTFHLNRATKSKPKYFAKRARSK